MIRRVARARAFVAIFAAAAMIALAVGGSVYFDPRELAAWLSAQRAFVSANLALSALAYIAFYAAFAALALPGAWVLSVSGGALFGPWLGIPLVSFSSTLGATIAMLAARYLVRDSVAARFPDFISRVDAGVARDGARWLFAARMTPVIPYFVINLATGLTRMPVSIFALVTLVGAAPFAILYALAGARLATIERPSDLISAPILIALFALASAPFALKSIGKWRLARAVRRGARTKETARRRPPRRQAQ